MNSGIILPGLVAVIAPFLSLAQELPSSRGQVATTWDEAYSRMAPYKDDQTVTIGDGTLEGKIICGYQGWFHAEGDGSGRGWVHYGGGEFKPGSCTVDYWPDMTEMDPDECYPTEFRYKDGSVASVFSSYNAKTVNRHFKWMAEYGIDGAFLQRFGSDVRTPQGFDRCNAILDNVRNAANQHKRTWAVMYDLSGLKAGEVESVVRADWKCLVDSMAVTKDPAYQRHAGKPLVIVWGIGFNDKRQYTLAECRKLVEFLKNDPVYGGNSLMLGVPYGWCTQTQDSVAGPDMDAIIRQADVISPWSVGRYSNIETFRQRLNATVRPDIRWCRQNHVSYMPVIFPGFRWDNLRKYNNLPPTNHISRDKGAFFAAQGDELIEARVKMIYIAMFDEIDEGTAIFKCTNNPPEGESSFGTLEGLPSDHYLKLAGAIGKKLKETNK